VGREEKGPGLKPLDSARLIQRAEAPCSLRKTHTGTFPQSVNAHASSEKKMRGFFAALRMTNENKYRDSGYARMTNVVGGVEENRQQQRRNAGGPPLRRQSTPPPVGMTAGFGAAAGMTGIVICALQSV